MADAKIAKSFKPQKETITKVAESGGLSAADAKYALQYIDHYYVDPKKIAKFSDDVIKKNVKLFQKTFGLKATGVINEATVRAMRTTPRCGCPDYRMAAATGPLASKWGVKKLTYYIDSYVTQAISKSDQRELIAMAFNSWADVADLEFEQVNSKNQARLILSTGRGRSQNFDGPGNTLAWAYLPQGSNYNGQLLMRFDLDETWIRNSRDRGILYLNVAAHEFGHMLGLDHSRVQRALMAPYYSPSITKPQQNDDIVRIQKLYGKPVTPPGPPEPPEPPAPGDKIKVELLVDNLSDIKIDGKSPTDFELI